MKSPTLITSGEDEGLEEGEIVSDDFEDISDDSIVFTLTGKSLTPKDPLPALSLSSVSEPEERELPKSRLKRKKSQGKRHAGRKRRRRIVSRLRDSDNSDSDAIDNDLKLKLKAAVHVGSEEAHKNSLTARLRAMTKEAREPQLDSKEEQQVLKEVGCDTPKVVEVTPLECDDILIDITSSRSEVGAEDNSPVAEQEELDNELIQLRIEALKTAVHNKFANKIKKKKEGQDDTNKENNSVNSDAPSEEKKNGDKIENLVVLPEVSETISDSTPISPEEDEDILRALLLASMSKKITSIPSDLGVVEKGHNNNNNNTKLPSNKTILTKINNYKLNNNFKSPQMVVKKNQNKLMQAPIKKLIMPQVKPLIICLNDSDSDTEFSSSPEKSPSKKPGKVNAKDTVDGGKVGDKAANAGKEIETSIETFLKEQRAKVEAAIKPPLTKTVTAIKKPPVAVPKPNLNRVVNIKSGKLNPPSIKPDTRKVQDLDKSALKFLPASKREEYRRLQNLLKLKNSQLRKGKVRRNSVKVSDSAKLSVISDTQKREVPNQVTPVNKVVASIAPLNKKLENGLRPALNIVKQKEVVNKTFATLATQTDESFKLLPSKFESRLKEFRYQEMAAALREREKKSQSAALRSILKQLQTRTSGRLQIEERYKSLRPLVKKLNQVSKEQKQCEQEMERLLRDLAEVRRRQQELHDDLLSSVEELARGKETIDSRADVASSLPKAPLVTSTPIKSPIPDTFTCSTVLSTNTTPNSCNNHLSFPNATSDFTEGTQSAATKDCNLLSVTDPNDIDKVIEQAGLTVAPLGRKTSYISPLMDCRRRDNGFDPFGIVCPFEVHGMCKDPDCSYNHLSK